MVLVLSLLACIKTTNNIVQPSLVSPVSVQTIAFMQTEEYSKALPPELQESLLASLNESGIALSLLPFEPEQSQDPTEIMASLSKPVLIIESRAIFYSQLNGRFRWETLFSLELHTNTQIIKEDLNIPVFLPYHHQREVDALRAAESLLIRDLNAFLLKHLGN